MNTYYGLPLRCDLLTKIAEPNSEQQQKVSVEESIQKHIYLLITTPFRSCRFDLYYGCEIWEGEFAVKNDLRPAQWTNQLTESIKKAITQYETRLTNVRVAVALNQKGGLYMDSEIQSGHKQLTITVAATLKRGVQHPFFVQRELLIAPFSTRTIHE